MTLLNWYLIPLEEGGSQAHGLVTGHPRLEDGLFIQTSPVRKAAAKGGRLTIITETNHQYLLEGQEIFPDCGEKTSLCLERLGVAPGFVPACLELREKARRAREEELDRSLDEGELLLDTAGTTTIRAWFRAYGGRLTELSPDVHLGMFQDSILLWDREGRTVDFRYFPKGDRMEPYHVSDGLKIIKIRNLGGTDVRFGHSDSEVICPAGETTAIPAADHDREGLFSPDVVNGKGLCRSLFKEEKKKDKEAT